MSNIDKSREKLLSKAELLDALRIFPRLLLGAYAVLVYVTVKWYMALQPYMLDDKLINAPTNQHATLVAAVIGMAAVVIGLYVKGGRDWTKAMVKWIPSLKK